MSTIHMGLSSVELSSGASSRRDTPEKQNPHHRTLPPSCFTGFQYAIEGKKEMGMIFVVSI